MKRSEMIEYMTEELEVILEDYDYALSADKHFAKRKAEGMLDMLSGFGMIPPAYLKPTDHPLVPGDIPMGNGKFGTPTFEWENEDEKGN